MKGFKSPIILLFVLSLLLLSNCRRYPDGPDFTLRSVKKRLWGTFELEKYMVNGIDSTDFLPPCKDLYPVDYATHNGKYCYRFKSNYGIAGLDGFGHYSIHGDKDEYIMLTYTNSVGNKNFFNPFQPEDGLFEIRKLTNKEFWIREDFKGNRYEIHLKKIHQ